jgi:phosphoserine phosphatase
MSISSSANPADTGIGLTTAQMKSVLEISRAFAITADLESLLLKIAHAVCDLLQCTRATIWLHDPVADELFTRVILNANQMRVPSNKGIVGAAFHANKIIAVPDAYADPRFNRTADKATGFHTTSLMAVPMVDIHAKPVGVIQALNKTEGIFTEQDAALVQLLADQAGVAIQRHNLQEIADKAAFMQREMKLARTVQRALLPATLPVFEGFDLFGWAKPADETGGDIYDLWLLPDGRLGILLFDASGHGLAPALVVSQARTLVRALCDGSTAIPSPHDLLLRVHQRMSQDLAPERFITAFVGYLHPDGTLDWQSAGHGPILLRSSSDAPLLSLDPSLSPINLIEEIPPAPQPLLLQSGGMLAVLSDGISEAFNPAGELLGTEPLIETLDQYNGQSAAVTANALLTRVVDWQQHDQPKDDQTIVLLKRG